MFVLRPLAEVKALSMEGLPEFGKTSMVMMDLLGVAAATLQINADLLEVQLKARGKKRPRPTKK